MPWMYSARERAPEGGPVLGIPGAMFLRKNCLQWLYIFVYSSMSGIPGCLWMGLCVVSEG